jgi:uncharacterized protein
MEKLIAEWVLNAENNSDESLDFIKKLKGYGNQDKVDSRAKEAHEHFFSRIDCTKCANCCKTMEPDFTKADVKRIADFKNVKPQALIDQYLKIGDENPNAFVSKTLPCTFLEDNKCSIYEVRPTDCKDYPNTQKKHFTSRSYSHAANTVTCPAVYHIVENMKERFDGSNRRRRY